VSGTNGDPRSCSRGRAQTLAWPLWAALPLCGFFYRFDLPFIAANAGQDSGWGYVPIALGAVFVTVMLVWKSGQLFVRAQFGELTNRSKLRRAGDALWCCASRAARCSSRTMRSSFHPP